MDSSRTNQTITIRPIQERDAAAFLALRTQLDAETHLMMLEPGERDQDLERQYAELRSVLARANHTILLAVTEDQQLAGYLEAEVKVAGFDVTGIRRSLFWVF